MVYLEICLTSVVECFYEVLSFSNKLHPKFLIHLSKSKSLVTIQASIVSFFGFFFFKFDGFCGHCKLSLEQSIQLKHDTLL